MEAVTGEGNEREEARRLWKICHILGDCGQLSPPAPLSQGEGIWFDRIPVPLLTVRGWSGHKGCSRWGSQEIRGCEQGLLQEGAGGPRPPSAPGPLGRFQSTVGPP